MKDEVELPGQDFRLVIDTEESAAEKNTEQDSLSTKIADLSKRGYQLLKENDIHTAVDTSGYMFNNKVKEVLKWTDLVLLDIKHINPNKYKKLTSVSLEHTLEFAKYLSEINKNAWIRYVLVPGYSDDEEDLHEWAKFVSQFKNVTRVDILPFHQMGGYKWKEVGKEYKLADVKPPAREEVKKVEEIFKSYGLNVGI